MCFCATASVTAGVVLVATGAAVLPLVKNRRELLFAALPLGFGVHQLLEGAIWHQAEAASGRPVRSAAVIAWLVYAWFVLPIWLPLSVWLFETEPDRRRPMLLLVGLGAITGAFLTTSAFVVSSGVVIDRHHLAYQITFHPGWLVAIPYVAATCGSLLLSSQPFVRRFGIAMFVSMAVTAVTASRAFSSVWCFFAALMSVMLLVHYAQGRRRRTPRATSTEPAAPTSDFRPW